MEWEFTRETGVLRENLFLDLTWDWSQAIMMESQWLNRLSYDTACAMNVTNQNLVIMIEMSLQFPDTYRMSVVQR
jgi:hypothetical protein